MHVRRESPVVVEVVMSSEENAVDGVEFGEGKGLEVFHDEGAKRLDFPTRSEGKHRFPLFNGVKSIGAWISAEQ